ncbi:MAG: hypothetical protein Q7J35_02365 [Candidatus Methanoperedens sp.]|nr:hypothetical protein [Candidatus Methanoperedens sp.]
MSRKKIKMSAPITIRLPREVVTYFQNISVESMVPFGTLVRKCVVDRVKQLQPELEIIM